MTELYLAGKTIHTFGELPKIGDVAPNFILTKPDLSLLSLNDLKGKPVLLNVYPSIDTSICFSSVKKFSENEFNNIEVLCVSMDLPFALRRTNEGESFKKISFLSDYRNREFGDNYGLTIADGPIAGLLARAVILLDSDHKIAYTELVKDVQNQVDYNKVMDKVKSFT